MTEPRLGRLERIAPRQIWRSESSDFTPWLAQEENLKELGRVIGMDLELEAREKGVGPFSADLLCKNTMDGSWVVIENQLERTDHSHLGQILTYSAALAAQTIVWVAERFTEEHRAALDWLNEVTGENFSFFGLEIELWRIGDSPPAPKFNIVCKPNDWTRDVKVQVQTGELTEAKQLQLRYWTRYADFMRTRSPIRCQKPQPQNWMNHSIGVGGAHLTSIASMWNSEKEERSGENRVEVYIDGREQKEYFRRLEADRQAVEAQVGQGLYWYSPEGAKMSRIQIRQSADLRDETKWEVQFEWLRKNVELFASVFGPRLKALAKGE